MKIAMLGLKGIPATYGGVERHVEELSARLADKGHDVTVYCRHHYTPNIRRHRGVTLKILRSIPTKHLDTISHTALALSDALRRDFDVIHFHAIGPALLSFLPCLFRKRCAVICTIHAEDWRRRKWGPFARWWLRRGEWASVRFPHKTIAVSRRIAERLDGRRIVYIPNGVPEAHYETLSDLKALGLNEGGFILWLGRFVPEKRVEDLIRAFQLLPGDHRLLLGGELNNSDPYVKSLKAAAGNDPRILFAGGLYGRAKAEALSHAALVVTPSELEGFPIVLLEAMRYGRAVLASNSPEHMEIVRSGINGFTFPTGDVAALREKMDWLLSHPAEAAAAVAQATADARQYDWDAIARRTEAVYHEAIFCLRKRSSR